MSVDMSKVGSIASVRYGRDGHSKTTELATGTPGVFLSVFTFHRGRGLYVSSAVGVRHMPSERGFSITKSSPMDSERLGQAEVGARFSRKNLDSVHGDVVARTQVLMRDGSQTFARVLAAVPGERD